MHTLPFAFSSNIVFGPALHEFWDISSLEKLFYF